MTVSSEVSRLTYNGNGATTAFSVTFKFIDDADLIVYVDDELQVITTDYTVSGGDGSTGTVTFLSAPPSGTGNVVIIRDPAILQETDYQAADAFPAESHERALDRLTMIAQRNRDLIDRAFVLPDSDTSGASTELPTPEATKVIGWNSTGTALTNLDAATLATTILGDNKIVDTFTGTGAQTAFTLSADPIVENNTDVFIDGVHQSKATYSVSGTTLTFSVAPGNGSGIVVQQSSAVNYPVTDVVDGAITTAKLGDGAVTTVKIADSNVTTAKIADDNVTNAKLANMTASTIKARKTGSTGDPEDCTLSEVLDFIGSAAEGDILYRGASSWSRLAKGTASQQLRMNAGATAPEWFTATATGFTLGTPVSVSSGTSLDFTGIPAGTKHILINLSLVQMSGTAAYLIQIGDSGGIENSGYTCTAAGATGSTAGFQITDSMAAQTASGTVMLTLTDSSTNTWQSSANISKHTAGSTFASAGNKSLSATLDRVSITTVAGTATFVSGKINIAYIG